MNLPRLESSSALVKRREILLFLLLVAVPTVALADDVPQKLPLRQDWSNPALITQSNDWSSVPGFVGYRGDQLAPKPGAKPSIITADGARSSIYVRANQSDPQLLRSGGVAEFDGLPNPTVALKGSATASAPSLVLNLDTRGKEHISVSYKLRDLDESPNNAPQAIALQYRVRTNALFADVPAAYVPDATTGPSLATLVTPIAVELPAEANDQPHLQVRWITANADGYDEWVGVDDIVVSGTDLPIGATVEAVMEDWSTVPPKRLRSPKDTAK
jgi:uncharacterized protein